MTLTKTIITVAILAGAISLIYVYIKARLYVKAWRQWTKFFNDEVDRMDR